MSPAKQPLVEIMEARVESKNPPEPASRGVGIQVAAPSSKAVIDQMKGTFSNPHLSRSEEEQLIELTDISSDYSEGYSLGLEGKHFVKEGAPLFIQDRGFGVSNSGVRKMEIIASIVSTTPSKNASIELESICENHEEGHGFSNVGGEYSTEFHDRNFLNRFGRLRVQTNLGALKPPLGNDLSIANATTWEKVSSASLVKEMVAASWNISNYFGFPECYCCIYSQ